MSDDRFDRAWSTFKEVIGFYSLSVEQRVAADAAFRAGWRENDSAAAEARGIAARLEQPLTITESLLAQARAEGIAVGLEQAARWLESRSLNNTAANLRSLPHDPIKSDEGREG